MGRKKDHSALRMLALISQLGICMMTPTFFCVFVGQFLSRRLNQELIFPFLVLLGMMAGFRSCYTVITRFVNLEKDANTKSLDELAPPPEVNDACIDPDMPEIVPLDDSDITDIF